jgi:hypothetical protein
MTSQRGKSARGDPDPLAFYARLEQAYSGRDYTNAQRYRDFVRTFFDEENPAGKRVLYQIFMWAGMFTSGPVEPEGLMRREGARELCYAILATLNGEVPDE